MTFRLVDSSFFSFVVHQYVMSILYSKSYPYRPNYVLNLPCKVSSSIPSATTTMMPQHPLQRFFSSLCCWPWKNIKRMESSRINKRWGFACGGRLRNWKRPDAAFRGGLAGESRFGLFFTLRPGFSSLLFRIPVCDLLILSRSTKTEKERGFFFYC